MGLLGYRLLARRPMLFLRLAGPWLLLGVLLGAFGPSRSEDFLRLVEWVAWAVVSVAWSRLVLLGTECPIGGRLGHRERRYVLATLPMLGAALLALTAVYIVPVAARAQLDGLVTSPWFLWFTAAVALLAYLIFAARFQLIFPAIAIDDRTVTFRSSLRLTRGNTVTIFLGSLIASLPQFLPSLTYWLPRHHSLGIALAAANGFDYVVSMTAAAVMSGFCAHLYARQFGTVASIFD